MSNNDRSSLRLRAQEIINASTEGITVRQAMKQALVERYADDPDGLAEAAAALAAAGMSGLRKRTYELPDRQDALFEIPSVIAVRTEEGDLLIPRDHANLAHVRQWQREGQQHHATQLLRFKRAGADLAELEEEPDTLPWMSARTMLTGGDEADDE